MLEVRAVDRSGGKEAAATLQRSAASISGSPSTVDDREAARNDIANWLGRADEDVIAGPQEDFEGHWVVPAASTPRRQAGGWDAAPS